MKKLGGHLGILFLLAIIVVANSLPAQLYNDPAFLDAEIQRIRAGKAGDPIQPPIIKGRRDQPQAIFGGQAEASSSEEGEYEDEGDDEGEEGDAEYDSDYDSDEIEVTCAPGKGWHYRGQRCVPYHCPGGSSARDFNTGECLHSFQPSGKYRPYSQWNSLNHVYRTHPAQKSISRGMLSLLRRG